MRVRIRFAEARRVRRGRGVDRHVALGLATMLSPVVLGVYLLGVWRLAADLNLAGQFFIESGILSHWQVWMAAGGVLHASAVLLSRFGRGAESPAQAAGSAPRRRGQTAA